MGLTYKMGNYAVSLGHFFADLMCPGPFGSSRHGQASADGGRGYISPTGSPCVCDLEFGPDVGLPAAFRQMAEDVAGHLLYGAVVRRALGGPVKAL